MYYQVELDEIKENELNDSIAHMDKPVLAKMFYEHNSASEEEMDELYGCKIDYIDRLNIFLVNTNLTGPKLILKRYGEHGYNGVIFFKNGVITASLPSLSGVRAMIEKNL